MSFQYVTGTALAAPDEIVVWFAAFQDFVTACGWTVEAGAGTTDLILSSQGEAGGLTMLWARVRRDPGNPNHVLVELQDDLPGTNSTTNDGFLDSGGAGFTYWMSGDRDAFILVSRTAAVAWRSMYAGLVMAFAIEPPDETYRMIISNRAAAGVGVTILRRFDGAWDQDDLLYQNTNIGISDRDRLDNMLTIGGCYYGDHDEIAGELHHVSGGITDAGATVLDTATSGPGLTTEWIVLQDRFNMLFAVRTGGDKPLGVDLTGSGFAHETGRVNSVEELFDTVITDFMTAVGWTVDDMPGSPDYRDKRCYSTGELGTDDIWVRFRFILQGVTEDTIGVRVMDDAVGTHVAGPTQTFDLRRFPTEYWITADLDCVCLVLNRSGDYAVMYGGVIYPFAVVPDTTYKCVADRFILRSHGGLWAQLCNALVEPNYTDSNPNQYDATTYQLWQVLHMEQIAGRMEITGQRKYYLGVDSNIATADIVNVQERTHKGFYSLTLAEFFAIRTG